MPTKLNSFGKQQPYVPAGNGEASGEYGDYASGSNKHFDSFTKEVKFTKEPKETGVGQKIKEHFERAFGEKSKQAMADFNAGTKEAQEQLEYFVDTGKIALSKTKGISHYSRIKSEVSLNTEEDNDYKEAGETMYHEFGHFYDNYFAGKLITDEERNKLDETYGWYESGKYTQNISTCKYLSNGKTLYQTMQDELKSFKRKGIWDQIKQDLKNDQMEYLKKEFPEMYEARKKIRETNDKEDKIWDEYREGKITFEQLSGKTKELDDDPEYKKAFDFVFNQDNRKKESKIKDKILNRYEILSDAYGIHQKKAYGYGIGHKASYGRDNPQFLALEFFAEYHSAMVREGEDGKEAIKLCEKYFPESTKAAKELFQIMINKFKELKK